MARIISVKSIFTILLFVAMAHLCGAAKPLFAAEREQGTAQSSGLHLGTVHMLTLPPPRELKKEESEHIKQLIANLALVDTQDLGFSAIYNGWQFSPLKGTQPVEASNPVDPIQHLFQPMEALVRLGPAALPYLLEALTDKTSTKLTLRRASGEESRIRTAHALPINPLNPHEQQVAYPPDSIYTGSSLDQYTLTIGDLCMVAIGEIVGRPYQAAYNRRNSSFVINSPCLNPELAMKIRTAWTSKEPAQHLIKSLLLDYASESGADGVFLDGFFYASRFQVEAARRLLFYFPDQAVPMIVDRLHGLKFDVPATSTPSKMANGVDVVDFLRAVAWCKDARIQKELTEIVQRTKDPAVIDACHSSDKGAR